MKRLSAISTAAMLLALGACAEAPLEQPAAGTAPLIGSADGTDSADRGCNIVLREMARVPAGGGYATECVDGACWFVWEGTLDVSAAAIGEGATPELTYQSGSDSTWWVVGATPTTGAQAGYLRYSFRMFEHTVSPGMSLTSLMRTKVQVAPYLRTVGGGRLFDHNRNAGDLDNYVLDAASDWSISGDAAVCGSEPVPVKLASAQVFTMFDYPNITHTTLRGVVRADAGTAGETVTVHYRISEGTNLVRDWATVDARWVSRGVWEFHTPVFDSSCAHYCARHVYQFAIGHTANGVTEWDNNGGAGVDYVLADDVGGSVPGYYGPPGILDTPVQLSYVSWQGGNAGGSARGEILLENLAYHKNVTVVYSNDNWATSAEVGAHYIRSSYDNLEYWQFFVPLSATPTNMKLAVRYEVDGETYVDTNLGRYYTLSVRP